MNRKSFLKLVVAGMGAITGFIVLVPAFIMGLSPAWRQRGPVWRPVGPIDSFALGTTTKAVVEVPRDDWAQALRKKGVYVWRPSANEVVVFSRNCTDLSCPVTWDPASGYFYCPCHGGMFAQNGERVAGPPNRPLYRYADRIREGVLEIDLNSLPPMT